MNLKPTKEEKPLVPTPAQEIFKDHKLILERPEGMTFEEYWFLRKHQSLLLKRMFRRCPDRKLIGIIPGSQIYRTKRAK